MDSKEVNKALVAEVRPLLRDLGFDHGTSRTYWRYHPDRVDVVNFQSFNSYNAGVLDVTTYSYCINLGCFLRYIPSQYPNAKGMERLDGAKPKPFEYDCHLRRRLNRAYPDAGCKDPGIWYIRPSGENLQKAVHDSRVVLFREGGPWFDQFTTPRSVYDILSTRPEQMDLLWGYGRVGSPIRHYFLGYAAKAAGLSTESTENLLLAAATPSFEAIRERILSDARRAA